MSKYAAGLESLAKWSQRKITGKCALMHKRIRDVTTMYAEEEQAVIREVQDTAAKFGIAETDDEAMFRVLQLVLGSRGIDTSEPAPLFTSEDNGDENRPVAQAADGQAANDQGKRGEPRDQDRKDAGSESGRPGEDGATAQSGRKRSRRSA